jgi:hypothetical protein
METKYVINYWYDDVDPDNPYLFVLKDSDTFTGVIDTVIENVEDVECGLYFRASDTLPLTLNIDETKNVIDIYYTKAYRTYMYNMVREALTDEIVTDDVNVFLKLVAEVYGDLYTLSKNIDDAINIDFIDEEHLRHLCKLIGYTWVEALTADEQRESIKFYMYLRRMRGTKFGLKNLIRIFGQTTDTLYQASNNIGVRVMEYQPDNKYDLLPGDIRIEIPEMSQILRDSANDVKLMGTRLVFAYRIDIGTTNKDIYGHTLGYYPAAAVETARIKIFIQPGMKGWDQQQDFTKTDQFSEKFIYKYSDEYNVHASSEITYHYSEPFTELWMFQEPGLQNVRGHITEDGIIQDELVLYR